MPAQRSVVVSSDGVARGGPMRWWRDARRRRLLALADLLAASAACLVAAGSVEDWPWALLTLPLWILAAKLMGLYDQDHRAIRHLTIDEVPRLAAWALSSVTITSLLLALTSVVDVTVADASLGWLVAMVAAVVLRGCARWLWRRLTPPELALLVGEGEPAHAIRRKALLFRDMHVELVNEDPIPPAAIASRPDLGGVVAGVDRIIVASTPIDPSLVARLAAECKQHQAKLSVVSSLRGRALPAQTLSQVAELPMFEFNTWDVSRSTMLIKRVFDVVTSSFLLVLCVPLFPLIAIAIRLDSRGPALFSQDRAGLEGRPFRMYKLRTMRADAEKALDDVVRLDELDEPMFKVNGDPRTTRVGRFLRRFSLDELPQLVNVLLGQMSMVGPRPEQVELVERYGPEHLFRLEVKPGLTGPMQVYGRGDLTFTERLAVELDYIEGITLARDIRILAFTMPAVLRGSGAY